MDLVTFFRTVITAQKGWFVLAHAEILDNDKQTKASWNEQFYSWPEELPHIINRINELKTQDYDIYFSPYLFETQQSTKDQVIIGKTIVADLDEANVLTIPIKPSVLVETSPGRHQGYWILRDALDAEEHENLSKRLTYAIPRCDRGGWFRGKKVRVPETYNHKYITGPQYVRIVDNTGRTYTNTELDEISTVAELYGKQAPKIDEENLSWADNALQQNIGPQEMLARIRSSIPAIVAKYNIVGKDRSAALWALTMSLFRAGMKREQVFYIAYHSPNNKFKELRYGGVPELAKDVLRAELATKIQLPDVKARIRDARKLSDNPTERHEYIATCVREHLTKLGSFYHATDGSLWFVREDTGKPISLSMRSEQLLHMMENVFGINGSDKEAYYVAHNLMAFANDLPITGKIGTLSHYDHDTRTFILHTGRKDVLVVTPSGIKRENNGYGGIIFPWTTGNNAISPHYRALDRSWDDEVFEDCLDNILSFEKEDTKAILKVWLLTVLLRDGLNARPILALFGAPGSGKSTLFRRVYTLLYGRERGLNTVTKEDDFDHAMSKDPLVVLDNVDTAARWLPDRMAATISPTEISRRKLFTDMDTVTLRRNAMLGITAHDPKFGRVDVTDRFLLINFERLTYFKSETQILDKINNLRNAMWGEILQDIQKVLDSEMPRSGYPQFRIEDFAMFGYWIAMALNIGQQFKHGIESIRQEQRNFNLEEDMMLVDCIDKLLNNEEIKDLPAGMLWNRLKRQTRDERGFEKRYINAVSLGRRLFTLIDSLREMYDITWRVHRGVRQWTIVRIVEVGVNGTAQTRTGNDLS